MRIKATQKGANAIFLFIAELNGFKDGKPLDKLRYGRECWLTNKFHDLDYDLEEDRKDTHENIWLARLYRELDNFYQLPPTSGAIVKQKIANGKAKFTNLDFNPDFEWTVPVELDASASMLQYLGVLLNDKRLCTMTNLLASELNDPWAILNIPRNAVKAVATPRLYGSSKASHELLKSKKIVLDLDQLQALNLEIATGALGLADQFKEFVINNVKPQEHMKVQIWNEEFEIECNRYRNVGEETLKYDIYDTDLNRIRQIHHTTTKRVPDLDQFRRYFVTLLIHNLDSQAGNYVMSCLMAKYGWGIDIHDAFICNPEAAEDVRTWYAEFLNKIWHDREIILANFFKSIGIGPEAQTKWNAVQSMVVPMDSFKCSLMALK